MPGEDSFTTALIWALKFLVEDRKRFTTLELQTKIMDAPNFPKNQFVPVGEGVYVTVFNSLSLKILECGLEPALFRYCYTGEFG